MDGIHKTLHDYGYDSYVICWDRLVKDDIDLLSRFVRRRVDGLLLLPMECPPSPSHIAQLHSFHNPVVLIDQVWRGSDFDYVGSDNRGGAAALVEPADCGRAAQNRLGHLHGGQLRRRAAHRFS